MKSRRVFWSSFLIAVLVIVADQVSKEWLRAFSYSHGGNLVFSDYFILVSAWNRGASFSILDGAGTYGKILFITLAFGVGIGLLLWQWFAPQAQRRGWLRSLATGLIAGGAMGNGIDRVRFGAVYDFLYFHWQDWGWPAFNLADSAITVGVVCYLIFDLSKNRKSNRLSDKF